ncbi:MAG TPA: c-type cytochrome [Rhodocyclaceae bacterium]
MKARINCALAVAALGAAIAARPALAADVDAEAAKALAKDNDCFKCHAIDKTKKAPSYQKIAKKYQGKAAEGEAKMIKNVTTGPKVKLEDGTEEEHKIIDTKDQAQIRNLVRWILSL